jgi:outer membrane protein assembly factor BamB
VRFARRARSDVKGGFTLLRPGRLATVVVLMAVLLPAAAVARSKSVFRGQSVEWSPDLIGADAVEPISFQPAWTFEGFQAPLAGDPVAMTGALIGAARDGEVVALDAARGQPYWRVSLPAPLQVGPVTADGTVYQAAGDGRLYAFDGTDGSVLWSADLGAEAVAPPTPIGMSLLVPTAAEALIAIERQSGVVTARRPLPGRATAAVTFAEGVIVLGTDHGMVVAFDAESVEERWRRYIRHPVTSPPLIHDRRVYVAARDHSLHCLRLKNGKPKWTQSLGSIVSARMFVRGRNLYALCYDNDIYVMRYRNGHLIGRLRLEHRLDRSGEISADHLLVVPYTASTLVELSLPGLRPGGRFVLDRPGEWFTTSPIVFAQRVALGYGRDEGRIIALDIVLQAAGAIEGAERAEGGTGASQR